tara:strand:+ start:381 stop:548 length:168 start_codon:yes stop_codon:yes gene_type:complete
MYNHKKGWFKKNRRNLNNRKEINQKKPHTSECMRLFKKFQILTSGSYVRDGIDLH